jgi:GMP synthase-like glutamine amidotransferase
MIVIIDNGTGAEEISRFVRMPKKIVKPTEAASTKGTGYILTDGDVKHMKHNIDLIKKTNTPLLAIGHGYIFLGTAFGATHKSGKVSKNERIIVERPCPLLVDMKKNLMVIKSCKSIFEDLPKNFDVVATSKNYDFEIIQESEKPFFGVQFNPELGGDGLKIIDNFAKFVEVWEKYHKG